MAQEFNVAVTFSTRWGATIARPRRRGPVPRRGPPGSRRRTAQAIPPGGRGPVGQSGSRRPSGPAFPRDPPRLSRRYSGRAVTSLPVPNAPPFTGCLRRFIGAFTEPRKNRTENTRHPRTQPWWSTVDWSRTGILGAHKTTNVDVGDHERPTGDDWRYSGGHQQHANRPA